MYFDIFQKLTLLQFTFKNIYPKDSGGIGQNRNRLPRYLKSGIKHMRSYWKMLWFLSGDF